MIEENTLTSEEYYILIRSVGWKEPSKRLLEKSLKNSVTIKYIHENKTVGMTRLVTDYGYSGLILDVVVMPEYQKNGFGTKMINYLLDRIKENLEDNEEILIQLLAAPGKKGFYEKFGFKEKYSTAEAGMYTWLKKQCK